MSLWHRDQGFLKEKKRNPKKDKVVEAISAMHQFLCLQKLFLRVRINIRADHSKKVTEERFLVLPKRAAKRKVNSFSRKVNSVKKRSGIGVALIALLVLLLLIFLGRALGIIFSINKPLDPSLGEKPVSWDGQSSINFVYAARVDSDDPDIAVVSFNPKGDKLTVLKIADNTYLELPKNFGYWQIKSVYRLGKEENPTIAAELLKKSLSKALGLPIEAVLINKNISNIEIEKFIDEVNKNKFLLIFADKFSSDLSRLQLVKLLWRVSEIRTDKIRYLNLELSNVTESKLLPDSTRVLGINTVRLDLFIREHMTDTEILDEGKSVAIYNATNYPGIAKEVSRMVTNMGGSVVILSNTESKLTESMVVASSISQQSSTFKKLVGVFAPWCLRNDCQSNDQKVLNSRADINIILGDDYYKSWYTR